MTRECSYVPVERRIASNQSSASASPCPLRTSGRLLRNRCRPRLPRLAEDRILKSVRYALADVKNRLADVGYARIEDKNTLAENKYLRGKVKNRLVIVICNLAKVGLISGRPAPVCLYYCPVYNFLIWFKHSIVNLTLDYSLA